MIDSSEARATHDRGGGLPPGGWREGRLGFVMALVVFLLFAVGIAAATGYAVVSLESAMAEQAGESAEALAAARAGLERFVGEHLGVPRDSTLYAVANGTAVVRARRLATLDESRGLDLYVIQSEGRVEDPVNPRSPARRLVTQHAQLQRKPVGRHAAALLSYGTVVATDWGQIRGVDHSTAGACMESGTEDLPGIVHRGTASVSPPWDSVSLRGNRPAPPLSPNGSVVGRPVAVGAFPDHATLYNAVGLRWDVLTDPDFPVAFDGAVPDFGALASDEYPVVRYRGSLTANSSWSGRGVLIVTGTVTFGGGFSWDGIVLAGDMADTDSLFWIRGLLVAGLNGGRPTLRLDGFPQIFYDVCSALRASASLAYLEPLSETRWEAR